MPLMSTLGGAWPGSGSRGRPSAGAKVQSRGKAAFSSGTGGGAGDARRHRGPLLHQPRQRPHLQKDLSQPLRPSQVQSPLQGHRLPTEQPRRHGVREFEQPLNPRPRHRRINPRQQVAGKVNLIARRHCTSLATGSALGHARVRFVGARTLRGDRGGDAPNRHAPRGASGYRRHHRRSRTWRPAPTCSSRPGP